MARERSEKNPIVRNQEVAQLLDGIRNAENPLDTGAFVTRSLFRGLVKKVPSLQVEIDPKGKLHHPDTYFKGLVTFYNGSPAPDYWWREVRWDPKSGEISVAHQLPKGKLPDNQILVESAAPLVASVMLDIVDSAREYGDPKKIAKALRVIGEKNFPSCQN
jgi:hypothetical protein